MRQRNADARFWEHFLSKSLMTVLLPLLLLLIQVSIVAAQVPGNPFETRSKEAESPVAIPDEDEIKRKRAGIEEKLAAARKLVESVGEPGSDADEAIRSLVERKIRLYQDLDLSYVQMLDALARRTLQEEQKAELESKGLSSELIPEEKPYPLSALRRVDNEVEQAEVRVERLKDELSILQQSIAQSQKLKEEREKEKRKLREQLEKSAVEAERQRITREIELLSLEIALATANISLYRIELQNADSSLMMGEEELKRLERIEFLLRADVAFKKSELESTLEALNAEKAELRKKLDAAKRSLIVSDRKYRASRIPKDAKATPVNRARARAREIAYEKDRSVVTLLNKRIQYLNDKVPIWESTYEIYQEGVALDVTREFAEKAKDDLKTLRRQDALDTARLKELGAEQELIDNDIEAAEEKNSASLFWLKEHNKHLDTLRTELEEYIADRRELERLYETSIAEVERRIQLVPVAAYYDSFLHSVQDFWDYEITSVEEKPITIRKVVTAFLIFALGVLISRRFTRRFFLRFLERFHVAEGSAAALQSLLFYTLVLIFALTALNVVNVPLTVFTFVGGAVAIGFGFGSQNVMNNFISGIIILIEQPIRRGDIVQLKEMTGIVTHIGLRSTSLRTADNIDIIVPNSTFLEHEVVNWTLIDHRVRLTMQVGVAYGSPTDTVKSLLLRAVAEHEKVLSQPSPFVLFSNFGNDSLEFEVVFWSHIASVTQKLQVLSDIRFIVERLFREDGIVVAFPQRDIHVDTVQPLEVKILGQ